MLGKSEEDQELRLAIQEKAKTGVMSLDVAMYVHLLEEDIEELTQEVRKRDAELSLEKDHKLGLYDLLERRPRDRRLAEILCDWMNLHQKTGIQGWQVCGCELCKETKAQMNRLGDPIIHTARGWECVGGNPDFKTRDVAREFVDNTLKIKDRVVETEVWEP